mmetsp:Transcript_30561/g.46857  ORF Transcript_30561/g.46857 Transcript_30561/m.46857 type:complete len:903 (+) Transcript_30561:26-2734(+)
MSKFFKKDESSSEDESSEEEAPQVASKAPTKGGPKAGAGKKFYNSDDSESDTERVVVSGADKKIDGLKELFQKMNNHIKIGDFNSLQTDFDDYQAELNRCIGVIFAKDKLTTLPGWVLKPLMDLEDCINDVTPAEKKKMNKLNSQAFNKVRQKVKKFLTEEGDEENRYGDQLLKYRENPVDDEPGKKKASKKVKIAESEEDSDDSDDSDDSSDDSDSSSDDSDSSSEDSDESTKKEKKKKAVKKDSSSSEDDSSSEDSSSSSSSSSDDEDDAADSDSDASASDGEEVVDKGGLPAKYAFLKFPYEKKTPEQRRWKWVLFEHLPEDMKPFIRPPTTKEKKREQGAKPSTTKKATAEEVAETLEIVDDHELDFSKLDNVQNVLTKYRSQQVNRRNFDSKTQMEVLLLIQKAQAANKPYLVEVSLLMIGALFNSSKSTASGIFTRVQWLKSSKLIDELVAQLVELGSAIKMHNEVTTEKEEFQRFQLSSLSQILPAIITFVEKLDQQLLKAFQTVQAHTLDYMHRLRDECLLLKQCDSLTAFLGKFEDKEKLARIAMIKLEHIYYKSDALYEKTKTLKAEEQAKLYVPAEPSAKLINDLVTLILETSPLKLKLKAIMLQSYHLAIHKKYFEAKDLIMKTRLSSIIAKQKIPNQILYNRAIVQIGLAAFRLGLFDECNSLLVDVCQSPKLKESLAQGVSNYSKQLEKSLEDEIEEKKRYVPPHLHINLEILDCVYMITSMMQEIPNLSQNRFTIHKKVINRNFRKLIEQYDLKGIQFVAQNSRDYIVFAARNLHLSQWQEAFDHISQIKVFSKIDEFKPGQPLRQALKDRLKEVALKIYLIESQDQYESYSLPQLEKQFDLSSTAVQKEASQLILQGTISASVDPKAKTLVYSREQKHEMQSLSER